jgi:hypothetical protein
MSPEQARELANRVTAEAISSDSPVQHVIADALLTVDRKAREDCLEIIDSNREHEGDYIYELIRATIAGEATNG